MFQRKRNENVFLNVKKVSSLYDLWLDSLTQQMSPRQKKCAELRKMKIVNITDSELNPSLFEQMCKLQNSNFLSYTFQKSYFPIWDM
jgi:hypothetical protein